MNENQIESYRQDGYLIIRQLFSTEEIELLYGVATDNTVTSNSFDLNDQDGKKTKLTLWFKAGDDSFGLMSRCKRMVESVKDLLGPGEVCHFHSKVMQKQPKVGGAWEWHQDYGYWYKNGFLYPETNLSEYPRWSVISAYNLSYNVPFREKHTSCITPVLMVSDEAILESGKKVVSKADFLRKEAEITLNVK